ncbi:50S ribosomal protein L33 [Acidobacteria bacterium AH-259-A15]|nr:50S ribosomal protein L33 [Acidobacteria bacterium AH-259-A15]
MREIISFQCTECKRKNYSSTKNRTNQSGRLELKKYCKWCRHHTVHKELK